MWNDEDHEKLSNVTSIPGKHYTFAEKLQRTTLQQSDSYLSDSTDDSYAVDISISGSRTDGDEGIRFDTTLYLDVRFQFTQLPLLISLYRWNCRIRRGGSRGFVLTEDSLDEGFFIESMNQEQSWLQKYQNKIGKGESSTSVGIHS